MITGSIERAQKKVEENNFGIRKRLLEYDNVMNYQRSAIYKRRTNALYGERLQLDILNILYDTCADLVKSHAGNFEDFRLSVITTLGLDTPLTEEEFGAKNAENQLIDKLYKHAYAHYREREQQIVEKVFPVLMSVFKERGKHIEDVVVPFSDGFKQIMVVANLKKVVDSQGRELMRAIEKIVSLSIIDQEWKEHLRDIDDLRQSVQNAVFEQKDPLLVYKFEAADMFQRFVSRVNADLISFLMRAFIPVEEEQEIREARPPQRQRQPKLRLSKVDAGSLLDIGNIFNEVEEDDDLPPVKQMPIRHTHKVINRNDLVTVQYPDGTVKKDVKYKKVEDDLKNNRCVIVA
jgi:preprotein translocase subunit SecA